MSSDSTSSAILFLATVFPSLSLEEYCLKAIGALPLPVDGDAEPGADSARSPVIVRGLVIGLPGSNRAIRATLDAAGTVACSPFELPRPDAEPIDLQEHLAPLSVEFCRQINRGRRTIGVCGEVSSGSSFEADGHSEWTSLVLATLPQVYEQEESFLRRKLEAMAEFAAGAGHEINNPAATIVGRAGQLLRQEIDPERRRHLATIGAQAYRIRDMIGDAMLFARPPRPALQTIVIEQAIAEAVASLKPRLVEKTISVEAPSRETGQTSISADPAQLQVLLSELLRNAIEASPACGRIVVAVNGETVDDGGTVEISVTDWGQGLSAIEREHLFDPFFSGRQAGRGLGFGLPKAWQIARQHRGVLQLRGGTGDEHGTTFVVRLPANRSGEP